MAESVVEHIATTPPACKRCQAPVEHGGRFCEIIVAGRIKSPPPGHAADMAIAVFVFLLTNVLVTVLTGHF